jgi:hypothetical protein
LTTSPLIGSIRYCSCNDIATNSRKNQINSTKTKCSLFPGKSKQLRNLFQKMTIDRSSTGKMAESIRREAAYKFCKALFQADFPKKWPEMEAKNWPTEVSLCRLISFRIPILSIYLSAMVSWRPCFTSVKLSIFCPFATGSSSNA